MSAFLCDDDTFDYLASAAAEWIGPDPCRYETDDTITICEDPPTFARILREANIKSVCARYGEERIREDATTPYQYRPVPAARVDPVAVIKSCDCLDYQSCEFDDWPTSKAKQLLTSLREAAIRHLMPTGAYDRAPWGWTR